MECIAFHANAADPSLPPLNGGDLRYISFSTGSGEATFACTMFQLSLNKRFYKPLLQESATRTDCVE